MLCKAGAGSKLELTFKGSISILSFEDAGFMQKLSHTLCLQLLQRPGWNLTLQVRFPSYTSAVSGKRSLCSSSALC
ncbi:hypothetical protein WJX72_008233 [[Myrmecia] bisecta]|uniref:Uncharacterized protein n=1 Tax=[Myrmecia] bisecta TaxID=41462 RepID=A0AAW1Q5Q9_9CHLO